MKRLRTTYKVVEFVKERVDGKTRLNSVEWCFDDKIDALALLEEIESRDFSIPPYLVYVCSWEEI